MPGARADGEAGALGAGIGIAIDAIIRRRTVSDSTTALSRVHVAPVVARDLRGVRMSVRF